MADDTRILIDALTAGGMNKIARLARKRRENEEPEPEPLNAPYPYGGVGFSAVLFGAVRSDEPV